VVGEYRGKRNREWQREGTEEVTKGRDSRRNGGKETKRKKKRGEIEGDKSDVRDIQRIGR
jgi:hypothetical protein